MNTASSFFRRAAAFLMACASLGAAIAADAPGRVARLSEFAGEVQIANDYESWRVVPRNYTVTAGDNVWVSESGRAELDVGAVQVWLAGGSNVYFEQFDDQQLTARLSQGAMAVRIRAWEQQDALRIMTTHGEVSLLQPGLYLISADSNYAPGMLSVKSGQAEFYGNGPVQVVSRGQTVQFDARGARFDSYGAIATSGGFEAWVSARDRRYERWDRRNGASLSPWMIGSRELDDHGSWDTHYEYGRVWYPTSVASGWAPYRFGRWTWVQPWGWTWVDDASWGFAPFHYGRWVRIGARWAWSPGSYSGRPVYAPALVTFFGGNGWSVGANLGPTYSWVPLGWNEPFVPWYTYSPNYWRHVNRPYVRNVAEDPWRPRTYVHASVPGAVTVVAGSTFLSGRSIRDNYVRNVPERALMTAPPARMGEVLPQFRGNRGVGTTPSGAAMPAPVVRERGAGAAVIAPNTNVFQPRVIQESTAIPPRMADTPPSRPRPGSPVGENPGLRERAVPLSKDSRERAEQRGEPRYAPVPPAVQEYRGNAPSAPVAPRATPAPNIAPPEPRAMPVAPRAVTPPPAQIAPAAPPTITPPPRVIEQRAAPAVVAPPPPPPTERQQRSAPEPRGREKDRVPAGQPQ